MKKNTKLFIITLIISNSLCGLDYWIDIFQDCSEFENIKYEFCNYLRAEDPNKKCTLINNKCISSYNDCEDYTGNDNNSCESIIPSGYPEFKCVFEKNKCITKERVCSDFKIGSESISNCFQLKANDERKICVYKNNKCEEQYQACEDYKENVQQQICEDIQLVNEYDDHTYKCAFEGGKCVQKQKYCKDFNINLDDIYICPLLATSDKSKKCSFINNECIEQFKECEYYKGNDKQAYELIDPNDEIDYKIDYEIGIYKCVYEKGKCTKKKSTSCSDYKIGTSYEYCYYIQLANPNKFCYFYNNECIETYLECENYNGDNIKKDICESIIPLEDINKKCVFENNKCVAKEMYCSDFEPYYDDKTNYEMCSELNSHDPNKICILHNNKCIESYESCEDYSYNIEKEKCEGIILEDDTQKCVYDANNKKCVTEDKLCSSFNLESLQYKCENLGFYSTKKCSYSNGKCESSSSNTNTNNPENGGKKYFSELILIIYCLLIL